MPRRSGFPGVNSCNSTLRLRHLDELSSFSPLWWGSTPATTRERGVRAAVCGFQSPLVGVNSCNRPGLGTLGVDEFLSVPSGGGQLLQQLACQHWSPVARLSVPSGGGQLLQPRSMKKAAKQTALSVPSGGGQLLQRPTASRERTPSEDPYGKGWLIVVKPSNLQAELANLMDFDKAVEWHKNQVK